MLFIFNKTMIQTQGGFVKQLEKECVWRHYNLSIQRSPKDVDPYGILDNYMTETNLVFFII